MIIRKIEKLDDLLRQLRIRALEVGRYLPDDTSEMRFWELILSLLVYEPAVASVRSSLSNLSGPTSQFPILETTASALLDDLIYARGLIDWMVRYAKDCQLLSADDMLVAGDPEFESNRQDDLAFTTIGETLKTLKKVHGSETIVAYLDWAGAAAEQRESIWESFAPVGQNLAWRAIMRDSRAYYWRSSDSFYIFHVLRGDEVAARRRECTDFMKWLYDDVQCRRIDHLGGPWQWQMGVALCENFVVGDIFLPSAEGIEAAKLMGLAKIRDKAGTLILITKKTYEFLEDSDIKARFRRFIDSPLEAKYDPDQQPPKWYFANSWTTD